MALIPDYSRWIAIVSSGIGPTAERWGNIQRNGLWDWVSRDTALGFRLKKSIFTWIYGSALLSLTLERKGKVLGWSVNWDVIRIIFYVEANTLQDVEAPIKLQYLFRQISQRLIWYV